MQFRRLIHDEKDQNKLLNLIRQIGNIDVWNLDYNKCDPSIFWYRMSKDYHELIRYLTLNSTELSNDNKIKILENTKDNDIIRKLFDTTTLNKYQIPSVFQNILKSEDRD